jgi:hypothetical protein
MHRQANSPPEGKEIFTAKGAEDRGVRERKREIKKRSLSLRPSAASAVKFFRRMPGCRVRRGLEVVEGANHIWLELVKI